MEAFLNSCEDQEAHKVENNDSFDFYSESIMESTSEPIMMSSCIGQEGPSDKDVEIKAIGALINSLQYARQRYSFQGEDLLEALKENQFSVKKYCAILVQSELQTLELYELAAKCTLSKLRCDDSFSSILKTKVESLNLEVFTVKEIELIEQYAKELVETYHKIRHGE